MSKLSSLSRRSRVIIGLVVALILCGGGVWYYYWSATTCCAPPPIRPTVQVAASFYIPAHFAQVVGGDRVTVTNITPVGVDAHDAEPSAKDIARLHEADIFFYYGAGIDPWAEKLAGELTAEGVRVVRLTDDVSLREFTPAEQQLAGADKAADRETASIDPHAWLSPLIAQQHITTIVEELSVVDPDDAVYYKMNADSYQAQLGVLDAQLRAGLSECRLQQLVTAHAAFGYLAQEYGLTITPIAGLSPEEEPSAKHLAAVRDLIIQQRIKVIFFEELVDPQFAQTVARETGARPMPLSAIEGLTPDQMNSHATYLSLMRLNVQALQQGLECSL